MDSPLAGYTLDLRGTVQLLHGGVLVHSLTHDSTRYEIAKKNETQRYNVVLFHQYPLPEFIGDDLPPPYLRGNRLLILSPVYSIVCRDLIPKSALGWIFELQEIVFGGN